MWITEVSEGPALSDPDFVASARQDLELQRAFKHFDADGSGNFDAELFQSVTDKFGVPLPRLATAVHRCCL